VSPQAVAKIAIFNFGKLTVGSRGENVHTRLFFSLCNNILFLGTNVLTTCE